MIDVVKAHEAKAKRDLEDGIANLHEEEALRRHRRDKGLASKKESHDTLWLLVDEWCSKRKTSEGG
tara:strand:+ start:46 stop:243 length:198 start_codon:yes stop_codon:yes gene_type:complete